MNDLIRRQAAIDEIKEFKNRAAEWRDEQEGCSDIWHRADSAIASALEIGLRVKKLPSAQQWIPCSEGLPEESGDYLVTVAHHSGELLVEVDQFDNENGSWWHYMDDVIAWMSRPEPYKGEES